MDFYYIILSVLALVAAVHHYLAWPFNYWQKQGVKSAPYPVPGFGNFASVLLLRENIASVCNRLYERCSTGTSMIGAFFVRTPVLIVRDPELIKTVLVKEFQSFRNNVTRLSKELDPFIGHNPFFAADETWKESRSQLITNMSVKKLKTLFQISHQVSAEFQEHLSRIIKENDTVELDLRKINSKFTGEVVANTAFGIKAHIFEADHGKNSFAYMLEIFTESKLKSALRQLFSLYLPNLAAILKISLLPKKLSYFFIDTIKDVLRHRKENGIVANDFLQMTSDEVEDHDENMIAGHISSFLFDSYETSANVAAFACCRLSHHPNIQEKARQEIEDVLEKYGGTLCFEALKDMTYLDQIINETVRLHPVLGVYMKVCTQPITLEGSDGQKCHMQPGNWLCIPVQSLHTDSRYWRDPEVFDPDRFDEERKGDVIKFSFLPFNEGPRMCAGKRYGIMTVKIILITILKNYAVEISTKTKIPIKLDQWNFLTIAEEGLWAKLRRI